MSDWTIIRWLRITFRNWIILTISQLQQIMQKWLGTWYTNPVIIIYLHKYGWSLKKIWRTYFDRLGIFRNRFDNRNRPWLPYGLHNVRGRQSSWRQIDRKHLLFRCKRKPKIQGFGKVERGHVVVFGGTKWNLPEAICGSDGTHLHANDDFWPCLQSNIFIYSKNVIWLMF